MILRFLSSPGTIVTSIPARRAISTSSALGADLTPYRWKNRLLLLFSPVKANSNFLVFEQALSEKRDEVLDRDLIVVRIFEKDPSFLGDEPLSSEDAEMFRRRYNVKTGRFTVILIGKDGGAKLERELRVDLQEIFDLIDSMPMRQREMRDRGEPQE